jgi:acyl-CoA synthetase (NDP forming)
MASPLDPLLRPRSIAVVGVSREAAKQATMSGSTVLRSLEAFGFPGRIDIVHPSGETIGTRKAAPSVAALPEATDAVVLMLPAAAAPEAVAQAGARGIRGAIVMSAGFSELGDEQGLRLGRELDEAAAKHGVRICGPNGLGYVNVWDRVLAGYFPSLLGPNKARPGGLSIVAQSGAIGNSLLARAIDRGIGTSFVIASGNETNVSLSEYIDFLVDDEKTRVISLYLEGVIDGLRLTAALQRASDAGKPVVVYKIGKTASGAKAALSHTAKVAGEPALFSGLFRQFGAVEAQRLDELLDIPMLLLKAPAGRAPRGVGIVSISGGLGAVLADHFSAEGFDVPTLSADTQDKLRSLPTIKLGATANPVDMTAAIQRTEATIAEILAITAADPAVDAIAMPNAARFPDAALNVAGLMAEAAKTIAKPFMSVWYAGTENAAAIHLLHASERVASFDDATACARALAALRGLRAHREGGVRPVLQAPPGARAAALQVIEASAEVLDEAAGKQVLRAYGIGAPQERVARSAAEAVEAAQAVGMPVAMKVVSADVPHKAQAGGVRLGVNGADAVRQVYGAIVDAVSTHVPAARIDGVLVTPMVDVRLELLAGAYRDAQFGPVFVAGIGGGDVEALPDVSMRVLPLRQGDAAQMLGELRDRRVRLLSAAERETLATAIERIAAMAWDLRETVADIDVNPVALTRGGEALALDALIGARKNEETSA